MSDKIYKKITVEEFENYIVHEEGFKREQIRGTIECTYTKYHPSKQARILVYSSITQGKARRRGGDAIRVVVQIKNDDGNFYPFKKAKRVNRIQTWRKNLELRITEAYKVFSKNTCSKCDSLLVLRDGPYGKFYSCINYRQSGCKGMEKY